MNEHLTPYEEDIMIERDTKILDWIKKIYCNNVLDIGTGKGEFLEKVRNIRSSAAYFGVERNAKWIGVAKKKGFKCIQCDLEKDKINFKNRFDLILCLDVLEHICNADHVLREIKKNASDNGMQIFSVPNYNSAINRISVLLGMQPMLIDASLEYKGKNIFFQNEEPYGHIRLYNARSFKGLLEKHGFEVIKEDWWNLNLGGMRGGVIKALGRGSLKTSILLYTRKKNKP